MVETQRASGLVWIREGSAFDVRLEARRVSEKRTVSNARLFPRERGSNSCGTALAVSVETDALETIAVFSAVAVF
jgi:hypothetical protein